MIERPSEQELALDAIDEAFKRSVMQSYVDLTTYSMAPIRTSDDALKQARKTYWFAKGARDTAIKMVKEKYRYENGE